MPTQSPWQLVIAAAVQHALHLQTQHQWRWHQIYAAQWAEYEDSSGSSDCSSDCDSSNSSSSSSDSDSSSSLSSIDSQDHVKEALKSLCWSYTISACHAQTFICLLLTTCCLFPHEVIKCSQLDLVLNCFKIDDPYCFQLNLCVSPSTFNALLTLIENHPTFYNNSYQEQMPIEYQLAIALYQFGHFGNAASVELVAQWAGCSAGSIVNATHWVIGAFCHSMTKQSDGQMLKRSEKHWTGLKVCHVMCGVLASVWSMEPWSHYIQNLGTMASNYLIAI